MPISSHEPPDSTSPSLPSVATPSSESGFVPVQQQHRGKRQKRATVMADSPPLMLYFTRAPLASSLRSSSASATTISPITATDSFATTTAASRPSRTNISTPNSGYPFTRALVFIGSNNIDLPPLELA